jgi:hypothetical protein
MPNRKFYIEYYYRNRIHRQPIRRWADENRQIFPEFGFTNSQSDFPITHFIADRLERQYGFERVEINNEVILRNNNRNFRL